MLPHQLDGLQDFFLFQIGKIFFSPMLIYYIYNWSRNFLRIDISNFLNILEGFRIMSKETKESIISTIDNFELEKFIEKYHFDYVLSQKMIDWLGDNITGQILKQFLTTAMFYKIFTPFRYILSLSVTKLLVSMNRSLFFNRETFRLVKRRSEVFKNRLILNKFILNQFKNNKKSIDLFAIHY
jgi:hypothetical protein